MSSQSTSDVRWTTTDRGFKHYAPVDVGDHIITVYESSRAFEPHLWIDTDGNTEHVPLAQAIAYRGDLAEDDPLRATLTVAIERHYQMREAGEPWKAGDQCEMCGSPDTGEEDGAAFCRSCGVDERNG